jgi:hypothetical protein
MTSGYQIGDLVVYKVEYKDTEGLVRGKPRPLIIISEPNSKGDYLAIAGSTKIHQWFEEKIYWLHRILFWEEGLTSRPFSLQASRF